MILPRLKDEKKYTGAFKGALIFDKECKASSIATKVLELFNVGITFRKGAKPNVFFKEENRLKKGAYRLSVKKDAIEIIYGDNEGIRNAVSTLVWSYKNGEIECCEITDEPDNIYRSCMLDLARGYVELPVLREHIIRMAYLKYNYLHLHLMDRQSYALKSDVVPNSSGHRVYSKKEMREIIKLCKKLQIEIIPEIEIPAHAVNIIKEFPVLSCDIIDKKTAVEKIKALENPRKREFTDNKNGVSSWVVCAGKETTYMIYEKIVRELCSLFDGEYFHIGGDELVLKTLGAHPHWDNCSFCKKKMEEENLSSIQELYLYIIKRINIIVKTFGKKMVMWNDCIDFMGDKLPEKDVVIEFWKGSSEQFAAICNKGYEVINADCDYAYVDFPTYMQEEKIRSWTPAQAICSENIIGGEMCAWETGNPLYAFYRYSLPVCMALFSDRVYNSDVTAYEAEYRKAVFSAVFLSSANKTDLSVFFDELIPPRNKDKNVIEEIPFDKVDMKALKKTLSELKKLSREKCGGKIALSSYIELLSVIGGLDSNEKAKLS